MKVCINSKVLIKIGGAIAVAPQFFLINLRASQAIQSHLFCMSHPHSSNKNLVRRMHFDFFPLGRAVENEIHMLGNWSKASFFIETSIRIIHQQLIYSENKTII